MANFLWDLALLSWSVVFVGSISAVFLHTTFRRRMAWCGLCFVLLATPFWLRTSKAIRPISHQNSSSRVQAAQHHDAEGHHTTSPKFASVEELELHIALSEGTPTLVYFFDQTTEYRVKHQTEHLVIYQSIFG